jgi:hypothetical protein
VTEDAPGQNMLAAIGRVAMDSGRASRAIQQLAEGMTGTGLIYFILRDATQLKHVQARLEQATANEWI